MAVTISSDYMAYTSTGSTLRGRVKGLHVGVWLGPARDVPMLPSMST